MYDGEAFVALIKRALKVRKMRGEDLAEKMGRVKNRMHTWIGRKPNRSTLADIARALSVPLSVLLDAAEGKIADLPGPVGDQPGPIAAVHVRILGTAPAGNTGWDSCGDDPDAETVLVPELELGHDYFAVRVHGESMMPELRPGSLAVCRHLNLHEDRPPIADGVMVYARISDDAPKHAGECCLALWEWDHDAAGFTLRKVSTAFRRWQLSGKPEYLSQLAVVVKEIRNVTGPVG